MRCWRIWGEKLEHGEYELCWWPKFLPGLYNVWKDHPDPTQNVYYNLAVEKVGE